VSAIISFVLARADNGVIGDHGAMPWHISEEMKHFKAITMGKPIVMGRKTWDSFPKKPLPGRTNIVITRDPNWRAEGAAAVTSLDAALARAESETPDEIAVIGGAEIWKLALPFANRIHLTEVHIDAKGDVSMPAFDSAHWREADREDHATADGLRYSYVTLDRR
jgi:dihydrofolate reductase